MWNSPTLFLPCLHINTWWAYWEAAWLCYCGYYGYCVGTLLLFLPFCFCHDRPYNSVGQLGSLDEEWSWLLFAYTFFFSLPVGVGYSDINFPCGTWSAQGLLIWDQKAYSSIIDIIHMQPFALNMCTQSPPPAFVLLFF